MRSRGTGVTFFPSRAVVRPRFNASTVSSDWCTDAALGERGGGIYINEANVTVRDSVITGNLATIGGAIYANASWLTLESVVFESNEATSNGGGLYLNNSNLLSTDTVFATNTSGNRSGAAFLFGGTSSIVGCEFIGNHATVRGGAIEATSGHELLVMVSRFHGNSAGDADTEGRGGGIYNN